MYPNGLALSMIEQNFPIPRREAKRGMSAERVMLIALLDIQKKIFLIMKFSLVGNELSYDFSAIIRMLR